MSITGTIPPSLLLKVGNSPIETKTTRSILNTIAILNGSTAAFPFPTILLVFTLWACVTFPLTVIGGIVGRQMAIFRGKRNDNSCFPCKTNKLPRHIPQHNLAWYLARDLTEGCDLLQGLNYL